MAQRTKVDAVWPGWGHASEIPDLPESLREKGIAFLGPPAGPMAALGDKIGSSIIAQAAGVPTLGWSGSNVRRDGDRGWGRLPIPARRCVLRCQVSIPFDSCKEPIPEEVYRAACVATEKEALASCARIGFPAMMKSSWGGGKGDPKGIICGNREKGRRMEGVGAFLNCRQGWDRWAGWRR